MILAAGPDWLGSPQHFVVGAIAAAAVYVVAWSRRLALPEWLAFVLAVSLVCTAELVVELVEYPLLYADHFHYGAYFDTLASRRDRRRRACDPATPPLPDSRVTGVQSAGMTA